MDIDDILKWMDDDDDVLASLQATLGLILNTKQEKKRGGSTPGRRDIQRNRIKGHNQLFKDYFDKDCTSYLELVVVLGLKKEDLGRPSTQKETAGLIAPGNLLRAMSQVRWSGKWTPDLPKFAPRRPIMVPLEML
ncbi:hypothetical protein PGT21_023466 [Puccinia graminis f. sp. tritici]|uniref:Uncharacterized protein n=1 Tax=Puccinia graminis f. sp. tritici TaxID=56615 RepID=A0A5B0NWW8_PUCGR|nr:hypothetical protein PGT21_023466 [Puccinia graminis f. sp. tritici]KAA1092319.1 hypothetical protein PGTUg99_019218 [Puccinia graminis f. sp. tritici]